MKYKVQFLGINGWYDMKSTYNGRTYETDIFNTVEEATKEALIAHLEDRFKVVARSTKSDWDIYC